MTVKDFVGTYTVRQGTISSGGSPKLVDLNDTIQIGVGQASPPTLQPDGVVTVGLAVLANGSVKPLESNWPNPMELSFDQNQLRFARGETGVGLEQMVITLLPVGANYRAIAGNVVVGDPQQAGVWGADDDPDTP
jgi:hypothetical protein